MLCGSRTEGFIMTDRPLGGMKERQAARLKAFCASKELAPFEHLSSNNARSFISRDHTTDPLSVESVLRWVVFQQTGEIFFRSVSPGLPAIPLGHDKHQRRLQAGESGGWIVLANDY